MNATPANASGTETPRPTTGFLEELEWRGALEAVTNADELAAALAEGPLTLYAGFDPTATSLHVGSLVPIIGLARFQRAGHRPIVVAGGATGRIGDPSGKDTERTLLTTEKLEENIAGIRAQLSRFLDFGAGAHQALLVDNYDWLGGQSFLGFLRDVGKHFSVNRMIQKDSVRNRLENREQGISYTEFSYQLLQAYDFLHLFREYGCRLQIGGSDQWGNITGGVDLIRRITGGQAWGLSLPLLTDSTGKKFGKTADGTNCWLDPARTSPYQFYQFWLRVEDADVVRFLRMWTFLGREEIDALASAHAEAPERRAAHARLAGEVTTFAHGADAAASAVRASKALFGGELDELQPADWAMIAGEVPRSTLPKSKLEGDGSNFLDLLAETPLVESRAAAKRDIKGGGVYLNGRREADGGRAVRIEELQAGRYLLLRKGKANYHLVVAEG